MFASITHTYTHTQFVNTILYNNTTANSPSFSGGRKEPIPRSEITNRCKRNARGRLDHIQGLSGFRINYNVESTESQPINEWIYTNALTYNDLHSACSQCGEVYGKYTVFWAWQCKQSRLSCLCNSSSCSTQKLFCTEV